MTRPWNRYFILIGLSVLIVATGCSEQAASAEKEYVFITNNASDFWNIAEAGVRKAERELGVRCTVERPINGSAEEQQRILENVLARGCAGIAISPLEPKEMTHILNNACAQTIVICQDSDAPDSQRRAYVGTDNYTAGREAGKLMKEALPGGGKAVLFVGTLTAQNAVDRQRGIMDEIAGSNITVIGTPRLDDKDEARAKANAEAVIAGFPDAKLFVGLWAYNGPACAEAVVAAKKVGQIKVVAFDDLDSTLLAIQNGSIYATVAQRPFEFGYKSIRLLHELNQGITTGIPKDGIINTGVELVRKENVDQYWADLNEKKKPSE